MISGNLFVCWFIHCAHIWGVYLFCCCRHLSSKYGSSHSYAHSADSSVFGIKCPLSVGANYSSRTQERSRLSNFICFRYDWTYLYLARHHPSVVYRSFIIFRASHCQIITSHPSNHLQSFRWALFRRVHIVSYVVKRPPGNEVYPPHRSLPSRGVWSSQVWDIPIRVYGLSYLGFQKRGISREADRHHWRKVLGSHMIDMIKLFV